MSKIQKAIDALDGCDEYSLRHHISEVSILINGYAEAQSELAALREELAGSNRRLAACINQIEEQQQRLTAAEQRNSELESLLRETIAPLEKHFSTKAWDVAAKIKRKIKPTESGASE